METERVPLEELNRLIHHATNRGRWTFDGNLPGWEGFKITGRAEIVDGERRVTGLRLDPRPGVEPEAITASRLRTLPLADIAVVASRASQFTIDPTTHQASDVPEVRAALRRLRDLDPAKHDSRAAATVEAVAELWNAAYDSGEPPRATVCAALSITARTADRYIKRARESGLIDPTKRRRGRATAPTERKAK